MSVRFGTDGVRGVANTELTGEIALALGRAAARHLDGDVMVVGRDTRESGPMLLDAFAAGASSGGRRVIDVGVLPTPGIAYLAQVLQAPAAVISASHNPYTDNGIKVIAAGGLKLAETDERAIEAELEGPDTTPATSAHVGAIEVAPELSQRYLTHLLSRPLDSGVRELSVVIDCANGAAAPFAKELFSHAGITARVINVQPNGININAKCGSTHPEGLSSAVVANGADLGIAFDGDADRLIAIDASGSVVDGDALLALFAFDMKSRGVLSKDTIAITVMSNLGLRNALRAGEIEIIETPVGDRNVSDALEAQGLNLGGEQSGHIIFRDDATTGDGLLTALKLVDLVARSRRPLSDLVQSSMTRLPQELRNIAVRDSSRLADARTIWSAVERLEESFGQSGRVLVRASGTEPVVRVMVEAMTREAALSAVEEISAVVIAELS